MSTHVDVSIGGRPSLIPSHAIMVFAPDSTVLRNPWERQRVLVPGSAYAEISKLDWNEETGELLQEPWEPVTMEFVGALAKGLGVDIPREVLPANVLCRTREVIAWWNPPQIRTLFFGAEWLEKLSGDDFPVPGLVWRLDLKDNRLFVRVFQGRERPTAQTPLFVAPFLNVYDDDVQGRGLVCQGTMRRPERSDIGDLHRWEEGFFAAAGATQLAARATSRKGGLVPLFKSLVGRKRFPEMALNPANQNVAQFLGAE